jgi:hypothetical protein
MVRASSAQWLIIQGRRVGNDLAPSGACAAPLRFVAAQQPQPAGWRSRA